MKVIKNSFHIRKWLKTSCVDLLMRRGLVSLISLEKVNSEYITDKKLIKRMNDVVWKVRCQDQWLYIYILLEFQSKPDATMALRMMTYLGLLYLDLYEAKEYTKDKISGYPKLPPVFPIVL